jgi:hypothetical protein
VNPFGIDSDLVGIAATVGNLIAIPVALAALASFILRLRRAHDVERQQLKWFGFTAAVAIGTLLLSIVTTDAVSDAAWVATMLALTAVPAAIAVAILRYRLWDIDRIVSRTIAYALISVVLGSLFAILVIGLQTVLPVGIAGSGLLVAASTLVTAAAFQPLRRIVQVRVDRRFDRARVDADRTARAFSARVQGAIDLDTIIGDAEHVIRDSLAPASIRTWIATGGRHLDHR